MFSKIVVFGALLAAANAGLWGHGHAMSYQNIVHHDHPHHYVAPVAHYAPIAHYATAYAHHTPVVHHAVVAHHDDHDTHAHPKYHFDYAVSDPHTGDHKSQAESRDGDSVRGYYSLAQPDGTIRKVEYTADAHNGFNAIVHNHGHAVHPVPVHGPVHHH